MEDNSLLPIGSVVLLKTGKHRLMIIGYTPLRNDSGQKIYDYWGCFYPEGVLELDKTFTFNHGDIETIVNVGYSDAEEKVFRSKMIKILTDIKNPDGTLKMSQEELGKYMIGILKGGIK